MLPQRMNDVSSFEIMKLLKLTGKNTLETISFKVPRKVKI
jgi:hypothetical protein